MELPAIASRPSAELKREQKAETKREHKARHKKEKELRRAGPMTSYELREWTLKTDKTKLLKLVSVDGNLLLKAPKEFRGDYDVVVAAVRAGIRGDEFDEATKEGDFFPALIRAPAIRRAVDAENRAAVMDDPAFAWTVKLEERALVHLRWGDGIGSTWTDGSERRQLRCNQKLPLTIKTLGGDDRSLDATWWQIPGGDLVALIKARHPDLNERSFVLRTPNTNNPPTVLELLVSGEPFVVIVYT